MISNIVNKISLLQGDSLKAKSARGMIKLSAGTGVERFLRLVRTMILTRVLAPEQFGTMAIILVLVNIFERLSEVGISISVVQNKRGSEPGYLNATWWVQAVRGIGLFIIAWIAAPFICSFYDKPYLLKLLQVSLLSILFRGFISPRSHTLQKEYKFGLMTLYIQGGAMIGTIVTIICAFTLRNIWALVIGYVAEHFALVILSYIVGPFRPRLSIDRECLKELIAFARGMFGLSMFSFLAFAAPTFVLGKVVSDELLGLYTLADQLVNMPMLLFIKIVKPVILPGLSKKQDDIASIKRVIYRLTKITSSMALPMVGYIMTFAPALMVILWGSAYVDGAIPCVFMSLLILIKAQGFVLSSLYYAVGKPHMQRNFTVVQTLVVIVLIYPAIMKWGLIGAAITTVIGSSITLLMQVLWAQRIIGLDLRDYIKSYIPGLLMTFIPVITIYLLIISGMRSLYLILAFSVLVLLASYAIYFKKTLLVKSYDNSSQVNINPVQIS